jgi:precorrin-4/cobalt-precorrin-4 C11-methyltransferase
MTQHKVYFIGAGPGSADHLTLLGARALQECATVFAPLPFETTFASHLVGKEILIPFLFNFVDLLATIDDRLEKTSVAFLIPGDLTFYSPFQAFIDLLGPRAVVIPGVGTANVASARLKKTLDLPGVCNRTILASPRTLGNGPNAPTLAQLAAPGVTLIIYMNNLPLPQLVAELKSGYGADVPITLCHRLDLPGETIIIATLDTLVVAVGDRDFFNLSGSSQRPALTLLIVGETLTATVDGSWWDFRYETLWRHSAGQE